MHDAVIQLIAIALDNWSDYDAWCLSRGFNPLDIPSRRFINSIWTWITEGMEAETKNNLIDALYQIPQAQPKQRHSEAVAADGSVTKKVEVNPSSKWKAPEGWKPPGWLDDETAYRNAIGFIDAQNNGFQ